MEEPNLGGGLGGSAAEGNAASSMGNSVVNSRLSVDLKMLEGLNSELSKLNENTKKIKSNFKDLIVKMVCSLNLYLFFLNSINNAIPYKNQMLLFINM